jgi:hypothetical protein
MEKNKVVHINFTPEDHKILKEMSDRLDMPIATYCKGFILSCIKKDIDGAEYPYPQAEIKKRKIRNITNR